MLFFQGAAVQNEADLQLAYTSAIMAAEETPRAESGSPIDYKFAEGRATNYAYNQNGACGFGDINKDESLGNIFDVERRLISPY